MKDIYFSVQNTVTALIYLINIIMSYNNVNYFFSNFENIGYFCEASGFEFEMKYVTLLAPSYILC